MAKCGTSFSSQNQPNSRSLSLKKATATPLLRLELFGAIVLSVALSGCLKLSPTNPNKLKGGATNTTVVPKDPVIAIIEEGARATSSAPTFSLSNSVVTVTASSVVSGADITIALNVKDAQGAPLTSGGLTVLFNFAGGTSTGTVSAVTDLGNGTYQATLTGIMAGTASTVTATINGGTVLNTASVMITPGAPVKLGFSVQPSAIGDADSNLSTQPVIEVQDANGNRISGATDSITLAAYSDASCSTPVGGALSANTNPLSAVGGAATFSGVRITKTSVIRIGAASGSLASACSSAISISAGAATHLAFATQPSGTGNTDSALATQPVIEVRDANDNRVAGSSISITLTAYSDASCSTSVSSGISATTNPLSASAGSASFSGVKVLKTNAIRIGASAAGLTSVCSNALSISTGAAAKLAFVTQPSSTGNTDTALSTQPAVEIQDANGNKLTAATDAITLTAYSDTSCSTSISSGLSATTNPVSASSGTATFAGVKVLKTNAVRIGASSGSLTSACSSAIAISPGAAAKLAFSTQPSSSTDADTALATQPAVEVQDANGNRVTGATDSITLTAYSDASCSTSVGSGISATTNPLSATAGVAGFSGTKLLKTNVIRIGASSGTLTSACSNVVSVSAGVASQLVFTTQPSATGDTDNALSTQPVIEVRDAQGNKVSGSSASITLTAYSDTGCSTAITSGITATSNPLSASSGVATFSGTKVLKTNAIRIGAASSGLTAACSNAITISAGAASKLAFTTQPSGTGNADTALSTQPVLEVQDANGNRVTSATDSITLTAYSDTTCSTSVTSGIAATTNPLAAVSGVASFGGVKILKTNAIRIGASSGSLTAACSSAISITAGAAAQLVFTTQPSATGDADTALAAQPVVEVRDAQGNKVTTATDSITLTAYSDASCTTSVSSGLSASANPVSASSGSATFSGVTVLKTSTLRLGASSGSLTAACSSAISISSGAATQLVFSTQPSATGDTDTALSTQPAVEVRDANGNKVTGSSASITLTAYSDTGCSTAITSGISASSNPLSASSGVATFSGTKVLKTNAIRIGAASSGLTATCSNAITISAGAAAKLVFSTQPASTGDTDTALSTQPVVEVQDANSNRVTSATDSITLAAYSDSSCSTSVGSGLSATTNPVTASTGRSSFAGVKVLKTSVIRLGASSGALTPACSIALTIAPGAPSTLTFTSQPSNTEMASVMSSFAVTLKDANSNICTNSSAAVTIAIGTNPGTGSVLGNLVVNAASGVATFSTLRFTTPGSGYTLTATSPSVSSATSSSFNITEINLITNGPSGLVMYMDAADKTLNSGAAFADTNCAGPPAAPTSWTDVNQSMVGTLTNFTPSNPCSATTGWAGSGTSASPYVLNFNGAAVPSNLVTFGAEPKLDLSIYSIFAWFKRTGAGTNTSSGTGGFTNFEPIVTRGGAEAEADACDENYLLGLDVSTPATPRLGHDFEAQVGQGNGCTDSKNSPVSGTATVISDNTWYTAGVAFDYTSSSRTFFINGKTEATNAPPADAHNGCKPASSANAISAQTNKSRMVIGSTVSSGAGGTCNATPTQKGAFKGAIPIVAIYNRAITTSEARKLCNARKDRYGIACSPAVNQSTLSIGSATVTHPGTTTITVQSKDSGGVNMSAGGSSISCSYTGGSSVGTLPATLTDNGDGTYSGTFTSAGAGTGKIICTMDGALISTSTPSITVN